MQKYVTFTVLLIAVRSIKTWKYVHQYPKNISWQEKETRLFDWMMSTSQYEVGSLLCVHVSVFTPTIGVLGVGVQLKWYQVEHLNLFPEIHVLLGLFAFLVYRQVIRLY